MRKEADDIGPKAELDHWKKRMAKFNSLLDQIKGQECKAALGIMIAAKSKLIKVCGLLAYLLSFKTATSLATCHSSFLSP